MKSILAAIGAALRGVFAVARSVVMLPFNMLANMLGGGAMPEPPAGDSQVVEELKTKIRASNEAAVAEAAEAMAKVVSNWSMDCIIEDRVVQPPTPPRVSRAVSDWLGGLSRHECLLLVGSEIPAISRHIQGKTPIEGLRAVQKLQSEPWPAIARAEWIPEIAEPEFTVPALGAR